MDFIVAEKESPHGWVVIVTDADLVGKNFHERNLQLDLASNFYSGKKCDELQVVAVMKKAYVLHLTGDNAVNLGIAEGLVEKVKILRVQNIPHAEVIIER